MSRRPPLRYRPIFHEREFPTDAATEALISRVRDLPSDAASFSLHNFRAEGERVFSEGVAPVVEYYLRGDMGDCFSDITHSYRRPFSAISLAAIFTRNHRSFESVHIKTNIRQLGHSMTKYLKAQHCNEERELIESLKILGLVRQAFQIFPKERPVYMPYIPQMDFDAVIKKYSEKRKEFRMLMKDCIQYVETHGRDGGGRCEADVAWLDEMHESLRHPFCEARSLPVQQQPPPHTVQDFAVHRRLPPPPTNSVTPPAFPFRDVPGQMTPPQTEAPKPHANAISQATVTHQTSSARAKDVGIARPPPPLPPPFAAQHTKNGVGRESPGRSIVPPFLLPPHRQVVTPAAANVQSPAPVSMPCDPSLPAFDEFTFQAMQNKPVAHSRTNQLLPQPGRTRPRQKTASVNPKPAPQPVPVQAPQPSQNESPFFIGLDDSPVRPPMRHVVESFTAGNETEDRTARLQELEERFGALWKPSRTREVIPGSWMD